MDKEKLDATIESGQFDKESLDLATDLIKQKLSAGEPISFGDMGTIELEHRPTTVETKDDGTVEIYPPQNKVRLSK